MGTVEAGSDTLAAAGMHGRSWHEKILLLIYGNGKTREFTDSYNHLPHRT